MNKLIPWIILIVFLLLLILLDFFVFHKKNKTTSAKRAIQESIFFIAIALLFSIVIYLAYDKSLINNINNLTPFQAVMKYLSGYFIELSLSIDNLFIMAIILASFKVPSQFQHKLLFLGIIGALILRAFLISLGLVLIQKMNGITIIFGVFLLYTALKMLKKEASHEEDYQPKGLMKYFRFGNILDGGKFVTRINGKLVFTSLFGALITIEIADLIFALDSVPAIFAVTTDPFLVFSSNIFAIMGLRSLYFFLSSMLNKFIYLKYSVFSILLFVSIKLMTAAYVEIPEWFSFIFIGVSLIAGIYASIKHIKTPEKFADENDLII